MHLNQPFFQHSSYAVLTFPSLITAKLLGRLTQTAARTFPWHTQYNRMDSIRGNMRHRPVHFLHATCYHGQELAMVASLQARCMKKEQRHTFSTRKK